MTRPITIFYVYAETDEMLGQELEKHLALLQRQGVIAGWKPILAGAPWAKQTEQAFNNATLILLLVSADFLDSDVCYARQMKRALEREQNGQAKVIPILLRPVDWKDGPFAHLQVVPKNEKPITSWSNREEAFQEVAEEIRRVIEAAIYSTNNQQGIYGQTIGEHNTVYQQYVLPRHSTGSWMAEERQKIKALFLAANPKSTSRLAIDEEMHAIEQKVRASGHREALVFQSAWAVRPDDLLQSLNQNHPHIVHFSGHGDSNGLSLVGNDGLSLARFDGDVSRKTTSSVTQIEPDSRIPTKSGNESDYRSIQ